MLQVSSEYVMFSLHFDDIFMTLNGFSAFSTILSFPFDKGCSWFRGKNAHNPLCVLVQLEIPRFFAFVDLLLKVGDINTSTQKLLLL